MRALLIANRGEIAARIARTCAELGIRSVAVFSDADAGALHVRLADDAVRLPGTAAAETYLDVDLLVEAALRSGVDAVHPGYGFLAESAAFAHAVEKAGLTFVGPSPEAIEALGDKTSARELARAAGVPVVPGTADLSDVASVGWPAVVKAAKGGGGRGMRVVDGPDGFDEAVAAARAEALAAFGDDTVHVERYLPAPRHVEVQVLADSHGTVVALGDRDCSVQRRHQKLVEEAPAPGVAPELRAALADAACRLARAAGYVGAGTVEFLVDDDGFYFLEANTRIQVEHPVTELVLGVDLVREQLRIAAGEPVNAPGSPRGHAVECRINAEDPAAGFAPTPGTLTALSVPSLPGVRFDAGYEAGDAVPPHYDGLVGKLMAWGPTRAIALHRIGAALDGTRIAGVTSTVDAALAVVRHPDFVRGGVSTTWFDDEVVPSLAATAPEEDGTVHIGDRRYRVPQAPTTAGGPLRRRAAPRSVGERQRTAATGPDLVSPMQGTVVAVAVAEGDDVRAGQTVVTVEAMKMEQPLRATRDGTVAQVLVGVGDGVARGELLVRLHP